MTEILIADDDEMMRLLLARKVQKLGFEPRVCADGDEVLALQRSGRLPAILLLDWMMPGMSGLELAARLKADAGGAPLYAILVTSKSSRDDVVTALRGGIDDFLAKPCEESELAARLEVARRMLAAQETVVQQRTLAMQSARFATLGEMAAGIAHEINNPLAIIGGNAHLITTMMKDAAFERELVLRSCERILTATARTAGIVRGLVAFAREGVAGPVGTHALTAVVESALAFCRQRLSGKGVDLRVELPRQPVAIECQQTLVAQALLNLLQNAYQAVEDQPNAWIAVDVALCDGGVEIAVTDCGTGIPSSIRDKIMQPFFSTRPTGQGVGLGLSVAKGIAEQHQGELRLDSSSAHTRFVLRLPVAA